MDPLGLKKTLRDRMKEAEEPAAATPQPPPGSRTLSKGVPPTEAEKKASNEALVRMLRDRRF